MPASSRLIKETKTQQKMHNMSLSATNATTMGEYRERCATRQRAAHRPVPPTAAQLALELPMEAKNNNKCCCGRLFTEKSLPAAAAAASSSCANHSDRRAPISYLLSDTVNQNSSSMSICDDDNGDNNDNLTTSFHSSTIPTTTTLPCTSSSQRNARRYGGRGEGSFSCRYSRTPFSSSVATTTAFKAMRLFNINVCIQQLLLAAIVICALLLPSLLGGGGVHAGPIGARDAKKDVTALEATDYLRSYGYLPQTNPEVGSLISQEGFSDAIARFQRFAGLEQTGILNEETRRLMMAPRCGVPDLTDPDLTFNVNPNELPGANKTFARAAFAKKLHARSKRYAVQGSKWRVKDLSWKVSTYTKKLPEAVVNRVLGNALNIWAQYSQLTFKQQSRADQDAHIDIKFVKYDHGDGDPFDGPGKTLAHAFFPMFGGDAHFDDSEYWTDGTRKGTNLYQVAAHEFGHSLGLSHSDVRTALMAPFYRGYSDMFQLDADDIQAIQYLYGAHDKVNTNRPKAMPSLPPVNNGAGSGPAGGRRPDPNLPSVCSDGRPLSLKIDAVTRTADGSVYAFVNDDYYKLNDYGYEDGYPRKIKADWPGLPNNLNAGLTWSDGKTFFFKGDQYWKFKNREAADGYPKPISKGFAGVPNDIDSAFVWSGNGKTYFTKGNQYWRYDSQADPPVSNDYPRDLGIWDGLPRRIDSAFQWKNDKTYFFVGPNYYRFDDHKFTVDKDYPRLAAVWWFGCQVASTSSLVAMPEQSINPVGSPIQIAGIRQPNQQRGSVAGQPADVTKVVGPDVDVPFTPIWRFADERNKVAVMQAQAAFADDPIIGRINDPTDTGGGGAAAGDAFDTRFNSAPTSSSSFASHFLLFSALMFAIVVVSRHTNLFL